MSMSKSRKTSFNDRWLLDESFASWLKPMPADKFSAYCLICRTSFSLSNMGKRALRSHMEGKKHVGAVKCKQLSLPLSDFFKRDQSTPNSNETTVLTGTPSTTLNTSNPTASAVSTPMNTSISTPSCSSASDITQSIKGTVSLQTFILKEEVTKAEILWCLHTVMQHFSLRESEASVKLFPVMFPDSDIASKVALHRTKVGYTITHGLAPYFHKQVLELLNKCPYFTIGFDESLNKVSQKGQMDLVVRCFSPVTNEVCTFYFDSVFLGHSTASDLLHGFLGALKGINLKKLLQISMDGPNVNKKFLVDIKSFLHDDPDSPILLDIGTCGLHTLHNSYKAAVKESGWNIIQFLRAIHYLFRYVPARRADYTHYSGSSLFPLKYCAIRWLENSKVIQRAIDVLPHIGKYVEGVKKDRKIPTCSSFKIVSTSVSDQLLKPKLSFLLSLVGDLEPFLRQFQTDLPFAPLLYEALLSTMKNVMARIVKSEVLQSSKDISRIDLERKDNLIFASKVDIGYGARAALRGIHGLSDKDVLVFRSDCQRAMVTLCTKLSSQSPLAHKLTKGISCFDPKIAKQPLLSGKRLTIALNTFVENRWISGNYADHIQREFTSVCESGNFNEMITLSAKDERLDHFWLRNIFPTVTFNTEKLASFLKMVLILFHGNAALERGFSVNKEILVENLLHESLVAQRRVYDAVSNLGGIDKVCVDKCMIHAVRNARALYAHNLKEKRELLAEEESHETRKKKNAFLLTALEEKKRKVMDDARQSLVAIDEEISSLKQ